MFLVHNAGPCAPITIPQLREILLHHGYLTSMQIHDQYPDLTNPQFNYQELSVILFLLYTNKLNPEFYRGRMLPYGVIQQVTQLVLNQTYYYMFLAVHHVPSKPTLRSAHFMLWAKINSARFQRLAMSSIAFWSIHYYATIHLTEALRDRHKAVGRVYITNTQCSTFSKSETTEGRCENNKSVITSALLCYR